MEEEKDLPETEETEETIKVTDVDDLPTTEELTERAVKAEARAQEMTTAAQRIQAEFENYRRRTASQAVDIREKATMDVMAKMLPTLDVIDQALTMITDENVKKGVNMIRDEVMKLMSAYGVTEIEALGLEFDPKVHEAIMQAPAQTPEQVDTVREVFQKGYKMGDKVIRAARVIVNK